MVALSHKSNVDTPKSQDPYGMFGLGSITLYPACELCNFILPYLIL